MPDEKSEKWNAVMRALELLYHIYRNDTDEEAVAKAVANLMGAYDEWLD